MQYPMIWVLLVETDTLLTSLCVLDHSLSSFMTVLSVLSDSSHIPQHHYSDEYFRGHSRLLGISSCAGLTFLCSLYELWSLWFAQTLRESAGLSSAPPPVLYPVNSLKTIAWAVVLFICSICDGWSYESTWLGHRMPRYLGKHYFWCAWEIISRRD